MLSNGEIYNTALHRRLTHPSLATAVKTFITPTHPLSIFFLKKSFETQVCAVVRAVPKPHLERLRADCITLIRKWTSSLRPSPFKRGWQPLRWFHFVTDFVTCILLLLFATYSQRAWVWLRKSSRCPCWGQRCRSPRRWDQWSKSRG